MSVEQGGNDGSSFVAKSNGEVAVVDGHSKELVKVEGADASERTVDSKYARYDSKTGEYLESSEENEQAGEGVVPFDELMNDDSGSGEGLGEPTGETGSAAEEADSTSGGPGTELEPFKPQSQESGSDEGTPGKELEPFKPQSQELDLNDSETETGGPGTELEPYQSKGKEVAVPDSHGKELAIPEKHSTELVPVDDKEKVYRVMLAGVTEFAMRQAVLKAAADKYDERDRNSKGIRRLFRNTKRFFFENGEKAGLRADANKEMQETGRLAGMTEAEWQVAHDEMIQRMRDELNEGEMISKEAEESFVKIEGKEGQPIREVFDSLVKEYVDGKLDKDNLQEEMRRQLADLAENNEDIAKLIGSAEVFATDMLQTADMLKSEVEHGKGIDRVLQQTELYASKLSPGPRTQLQESGSAVWDKIYQFGGAHGGKLALAASVVHGLAFKTTAGALNTATRVGGISFVTGGLTYLQERFRMKSERAEVGRQAEMGDKGEDSTSRREKLVGTLNEMKGATVLTESIKSLADKEGGYEVGDKKTFDALMAAASEASAYRRASDSEVPGKGGNRRGYISYESAATMERERRDMLVQTAKARKALRQYFEANASSPDFKDTSFDDFYNAATANIEKQIADRTAEKDAEFRSLSNKEALKKATVVMVSGFAIGQAFSEIRAFMDPNTQGIFEQAFNRNHEASKQTILAGVGEFFGLNKPNIANFGPPSGFNTDPLAGGGKLDLDNRLKFSMNGNSMTIEGPNGLKVDGLDTNPDGTLTQAAQDKLKLFGVKYEPGSHPETTVTKVPGQVSVKEFVSDHGTKVNRSWWDNDTVKFDRNELKLDAYKDDNGNIVFSMKRMLQGQSFKDGEFANLGGDTRLALSLDKGLQKTPLMMEFNGSGEAIIDKSNPLYNVLKINADGSIDGYKYAEAVEVLGQGADGSLDIRSMATAVADGDHGGLIDVMRDEAVDSTVGDMKMYIEPSLPPESQDTLSYFMPAFWRGGLRKPGARPGSKPEGGKEPAPKGPDGGGGSSSERSRDGGGGAEKEKTESGKPTAEQLASVENDPDVKKKQKELNKTIAEAVAAFTATGELDKDGKPNQAFIDLSRKAAQQQAELQKLREDKLKTLQGEGSGEKATDDSPENEEQDDDNEEDQSEKSQSSKKETETPGQRDERLAPKLEEWRSKYVRRGRRGVQIRNIDNHPYLVDMGQAYDRRSQELSDRLYDLNSQIKKAREDGNDDEASRIRQEIDQVTKERAEAYRNHEAELRKVRSEILDQERKLFEENEKNSKSDGGENEGEGPSAQESSSDNDTAEESVNPAPPKPTTPGDSGTSPQSVNPTGESSAADSVDTEPVISERESGAGSETNEPKKPSINYSEIDAHPDMVARQKTYMNDKREWDDMYREMKYAGRDRKKLEKKYGYSYEKIIAERIELRKKFIEDQALTRQRLISERESQQVA